MQGNLKKHINSEQVKNMFQCEKCDNTFGPRGNFIDGNVHVSLRIMASLCQTLNISMFTMGTKTLKHELHYNEFMNMFDDLNVFFVGIFSTVPYGSGSHKNFTFGRNFSSGKEKSTAAKLKSKLVRVGGWCYRRKKSSKCQDRSSECQEL